MTRRMVIVVALMLGIVAPAPASRAVADDGCPTLRFGASGQPVKELQYRLAVVGKYVLAGDGQFGPRTLRIVQHFQKANGLRPDGIVGPLTQRALGCRSGPTIPAGSYRHPDPNVERWHLTALQAGWPDRLWKWQSCVIHRESRGNPNVLYVASRDRSYGLMQINALAHSRRMIEFAGSERAFTDPLTNLRFAWQMYQESGARPWKSSSRPC